MDRLCNSTAHFPFWWNITFTAGEQLKPWPPLIVLKNGIICPDFRQLTPHSHSLSDTSKKIVPVPDRPFEVSLFNQTLMGIPLSMASSTQWRINHRRMKTWTQMQIERTRFFARAFSLYIMDIFLWNQQSIVTHVIVVGGINDCPSIVPHL